jgi:hypothetical protein
MDEHGDFVLKHVVINGKKQLRSVCTHCGHHLKKSQGAGNEHKHLARKHPDRKMELASTTLPDDDTAISGLPAAARQPTLDGNVAVAPRFVEQAIRWVVIRVHPLSEVESESFRETLTSCRVRREILKLVHQIKTRLRSKFKDADVKCATTTGAWLDFERRRRVHLSCLAFHRRSLGGSISVHWPLARWHRRCVDGGACLLALSRHCPWGRWLFFCAIFLPFLSPSLLPCCRTWRPAARCHAD